MKKYLVILLSLILISAAAGCTKEKYSDIPMEAVTFGGPDFLELYLDPEKAVEIKLQIGGEASQEVTLKEKENIIETIRVFKELKKYKPNDLKCEAQDVKIQIKINTGETDYWIFKGIKPVEAYLSNILNSLEYKHQTLPIFKLKKEDIKKVKFESSKKEYATESTDRKVIETAFDNAVKHFETVNFYDQRNFYSLGYVYFYDRNDKEMVYTLLLRSDTQWDELLNKNQAIRKIKVSPEEISQVKLIDLKSGKEFVFSNDELERKVLDTYYDNTTSESTIGVQMDFSIINTNSPALCGSFREGEVPDFVVELLK